MHYNYQKKCPQQKKGEDESCRTPVPGGLDSTLGAKLMLEQGIEVYAINFTSPFCTCTPKKAGCAAVVTAVRQLGGITLKRIALGEEYLEIVRNPKHGYGSGMNPCIDCRTMKIQKAGEYMWQVD